MATLITKNSSTASSVPTAAQLVQGELAVNVTDKRLFTENSSGTVVELGTNPSTLALPNGTANGVVYLNGSKVATSGSALTFNGTFLQLSGAYFANSGAVSNILAADSTSAFFDTSSSVYPFRWLLGGSEQMRLTSTGLGIGTSSPAGKLHVAGQTRIQDSASTSNYILIGSGANAPRGGNSVMAQTSSMVMGTEGAAPLIFITNAAEQMRLDSSGNLGIGVTPSAWGSNKAIQVGNSGFPGCIADLSGDIFFGANAYNDGTWKYRGSYSASLIRQSGGAFSFFTAPSGTAGNAISFTQAMTLDASGRLGIGTSSPSALVHADLASAGVGLVVGQSAFTSSQVNIGVGVLNSGRPFIGTNASSNPLDFGTRANTDLVIFTNATERARITSGGDLLVGTTTSNGKLAVVGSASSTGYNLFLSQGTSYQDVGGYGDASSGNGTWNWQPGTVPGSGVAEFFTRFRSRASGGTTNHNVIVDGNLLVGTTSSAGVARVTITGGSIVANAPTSASSGTYSLADNGSSPNTLRLYNNTDSNNTTNRFLICDAGASVLRAEIRSNGGIANYSANDVNLSDRREKTNLAPAKSYLDTICAIPVQTFNYIDQSEDDPGLTLGVVAQDVQAVAPELVMESNWGTKDEPKMRLSIYQTDLQYALMKALQELKAEFDAYKATHP